MRIWRCGLVAFAASQATWCFVGEQAHAEAPMYEIIDLGSFLSRQPFPHDINDAGQVVVSVRVRGFEDHPAIWEDGVFTELPPLPGTNRGIARAIADDGAVSGSCGPLGDPIDPLQAVIWRDGVPEAIGHLGGGLSEVLHMSRGGTVCGYSRTFQDGIVFGEIQGYIYKNGQMRAISPPPGTSSFLAQVCDDEGRTAWWGPSEKGVDVPYFWDEVGGVREMAHLGGIAGNMLDMNNQGQVVGWSGDGRLMAGALRQVQLPAVWERGGVTQLPLPETFTSGEARSINEPGLIVGMAEDPATGRTSAVAWFDGEVVELVTRIPLDSGWSRLVIANSCNNKGQIVGLGVFHGQERAFLMTPIDADEVASERREGEDR